MEFKKQFKEAHPKTIGETDSNFDKSNYIDWIDKEYTQLKADKAELLEALEEIERRYYIIATEPDGIVRETMIDNLTDGISELIQKHKQ